MSFLIESNELTKEAEEYVMKHRLLDLFEDLCTSLCFHRPRSEDITQFLIDELNRRRMTGGAGYSVFTVAEIYNIFTLFDLKQESKITREQCKEALRTVANSQYQFDQIEKEAIPPQVDSQTFQSLCEKVLAVGPPKVEQ